MFLYTLYALLLWEIERKNIEMIYFVVLWSFS